MKTFTEFKQQGIGLIEVLVTALVIGVGILAIASLQGTLIKGASENKVRAEAMQLANQKMEQLRDQIVQGAAPPATASDGYYSLKSGYDPAIIAGTNESFYRYWTITDLPACPSPPPNPQPSDCAKGGRKKVQVNVAWSYAAIPTIVSTSDPTYPAPSSAPDADHVVTIQSLVSSDNAAKSNMIAETNRSKGNLAQTVKSPTTNAGSSTWLGDPGTPAPKYESGSPLQQATPTTSSITTAKGVLIPAGSLYRPCTDSSLVKFEYDLYTRRVHYAPANGTFYEAIELYQDVGSGYCLLKVRYNGGVIIPMKGRFYSNVSSLPSLNLHGSEQGIFCEFTNSGLPSVAAGGLTTSTSLPYACYVGGNCINGPVGTTLENSSGLASAIAANLTAAAGQKTIVTQCPAYAASGDSSYPANVYTSIGPGGWRGNLGAFGLAVGNSGNYSMCIPTFNPTTNTTNKTAATLATAREYYSLRSNSGLSNEGINKPYLCHDFLVVNPPNGANATLDCLSASNVGALNLAVSQIVRNFSGTTANTFDSVVDKSSCHVISGTVPSGVTAVGVSSLINAGFDCTVTGSNYNCTGTSKDTSVTVASTAGTAASCAATLSNSSMTATCNLGAGVKTHILSGSISAGTGVTFGTNYTPTAMTFTGATCSVITTAGKGSNPNTYSYNCPSVPENTTVTFNPVTSGFVIAPTTGSVMTADNTVNLTVNLAPTTHTVSGAITTSGTLTGTMTVVSNPSGLSCTVSGFSYSCSSVPNTWTGTLAVSGVSCSGTLSAPTISIPTSSADQPNQNLSVTCTASTTHTVSGTISITGTLNSQSVVVTTVGGSFGSGVCSISGTTYTCQNVPNGTWTGSLALSGTCSSGSLTAPSVSIPSSTTDLSSYNLTASCGGCSLDAPPTAWATTGTDPKALTWTPVACATGYRVYTCTSTTGSNASSAVTSCGIVTTTSPTPQTATTYTPTAPSTYDATCVQVKSTDGTNTGASASAKRCVVRGSTNSYTYN